MDIRRMSNKIIRVTLNKKAYSKYIDGFLCLVLDGKELWKTLK